MTVTSEDIARESAPTVAPQKPEGQNARLNPDQQRTKRGWSVMVLVLVASVALFVGAIAGTLLGYAIGLEDSSELEEELASVEAENASLSEAAGAAEASADAAQSQVDACQEAVEIAGQIVENRDADLAFWFGPGSQSLPDDPSDAVYAEAYARDQEYRQLSGQLESSTSDCLPQSATASPASGG